MTRLAILVAFLAAVGVSNADAAAQHKHKVRAAPMTKQTAPVQPAFANRPPWAAPQQCFTNDGYGRFLPCETGDGR